MLRPQILFDFVALEIKSFCGVCVCISISREVTKQSGIDDDEKTQIIARIEGFIPIINNARYHLFNESNNNDNNNNDEKFDEFGGYDKEKEMKYKKEKESLIDLSSIGRNELGFGIITNRKSKVRSKYSLKWDILDYIIYPSFLNKYYKWKQNSSLYFSTLFKNFSIDAINDDWQGSRRKIDDTYFNTGNIVNGLIIFLNKKCTKNICLIETEDGIYHTDDRIKYRNLKVPKDVDKYNDNIILSNQVWIKKRGIIFIYIILYIAIKSVCICVCL